MAVPKKRTGHSAQGHRRANWKATKPEITKCSKCGEPVLTHTVCAACGYYKGKAVSIKSSDYSESKLEPKKSVKKAVKKAEPKPKKAEEKAEEIIEEKSVEVVEQIKEEEPKGE
ncbi:MAG TPA: 50S ribosomal protein L32 [Candidatus Gastranaerophilaceae bacterium]|nr:50S ribosomal protein L32 [Candidatus Gastranaerophilaceae bacterium]